jgi:hypothetical protein
MIAIYAVTHETHPAATSAGHERLIGRLVYLLQLRPYTLTRAADTLSPISQAAALAPDRPNKRKGRHTPEMTSTETRDGRHDLA